MPRTGKNLYRRKDGRWEGRYIKSYDASGKATYGSVYAKTYREAKEKLLQARWTTDVEVSKEREKPAVEVDANSETFRDVANEWWESIRPSVKESTSVKYLNLLDSYIEPVLGTIPISEITDEFIETLCANLLNTGGASSKGLSSKTVMSVLSVIRTVLEYANHNGFSVKCDAKSVKIRQNTRNLRILSLNEQNKLCNYLCMNPTSTNLGIMMCLLTGLRLGEICALRWEDISLSEQTIYVHQTMQRIQDKSTTEKKTKVIVTTPKSACSIRTIPIPDDLARLIRSQTVSESGYFLTGSDKAFLEPRTMENRFKRVLEDIEVEPINFHSLRHTFATRCVELGFDIKTLSVILGHASVNITMNRYVHPSMTMKRENMKRISIPFLVK